MHRAVRSAPWLFAAGALAAPALAAMGAFDSVGARIGLFLIACLAAAVGRMAHGMPTPFVLAVVIGAARVATMDGSASYEPISSADALDNLVSVLVGIGLILVLAIALRSRRGRLDGRDLNDLATVVLSASVVTWSLTTVRLIDVDGFQIVSAISRTLYLPTAILLFTFIVDHLFTGLRSNRAMYLIVGAGTANMAAALASSLSYADVIDVGRPVEYGLYVAALGFMCAGVSHPSAPGTIALRSPADTSSAYTPLRLAINGACLLVPGILVATIAPVTTLDAVVRGVMIVLVVASVMTRLVFAVRSSDQIHHELASRVHLDELTQLATRARFVQIVDEVLEDTWRSEFRPTVLQLNLDRFKDINDSLGHTEANDVLLEVADRLRSVTASFGGVVARLGGDDFAVIDGATTSEADALDRMSVVRAALAEPVSVGERSVFVTASFGVAVAPRNRTISADELLRRADIATHTAKMTGRNSVETFDDSMQAQLAHRMDVEHALHGAIGRREMRLYYQPIVDISSGTVTGFEALIRWQRDGVMVSPGEFIPIAEETGMIVEIGEWALHEALSQLNGWMADGVIEPTTTISVNVSPRQIADPAFADVVRTALDECGVRPELLWLEVTESMMLDQPELAESTLRTVGDMGVRIALDDFGTGFSSLSMLQQFPIHRIKIDRAFVNGIAEPGHDRSLVRTVIAMAQSMGLDLVAEGVETVHQLQVLAELTCHKAQGFLISHPVPCDAMRSTMVALDELTSLSLFGGASSTPSVDPHQAEPAQPLGDRSGLREPVAVGAMSRPLGQPII